MASSVVDPGYTDDMSFEDELPLFTWSDYYRGQGSRSSIEVKCKISLMSLLGHLISTA